MNSPGLPPKKDVLDELLARGSARIFLDPRREGVVVPKAFANQSELVLRVGYSLKPAIVDLLVTDASVSCTLSFNRTPCWCNLPWTAVYAVVSDMGSRGVVWPDDVPIESQLLTPTAAEPKIAGAPKKPRRSARSSHDAAKDAQYTPEALFPRLELATRENERPFPPPSIVRRERRVVPEKTSRSSGAAKPKRELPPYLRVVK